MKKISKLLIAVLVIAFAFSSCSKKSGNTPVVTAMSMTFTNNGAAKTYNTCVALSLTVGATQETDIAGYNLTGTNHSDDNFEINIIHNSATLAAGQTYPVASSLDQVNAATLFFSPNATDNFNTQVGNPSGTVTITGVTSTTITGTFSGKLYGENDFTGTTLIYTITGGTFVAKKG